MNARRRRASFACRPTVERRWFSSHRPSPLPTPPHGRRSCLPAPHPSAAAYFLDSDPRCCSAPVLPSRRSRPHGSMCGPVIHEGCFCHRSVRVVIADPIARQNAPQRPCRAIRGNPGRSEIVSRVGMMRVAPCKRMIRRAVRRLPSPWCSHQIVSVAHPAADRRSEDCGFDCLVFVRRSRCRRARPPPPILHPGFLRDVAP